MADLPCVWCGKSVDEHGPPGVADMAKHMLAETGSDHWQQARLCPTPGVTSQFYTSVHQLVGSKWQGAVTLRLDFADLETADGDVVTVYVEQEQKRKPGCGLRVVNGAVDFVVVGLTPKTLLELSDFLIEAADMLGHCSA